MSNHGPALIVVLVSCAVCLALGIVLLVLAWRGRRLDDHPVCRSCKRDLFGLDAATLQCPECGKPIAGNTRIGNRARRPWLAGSAILILLVGLLLGGGTVALKVSNIQWIQYTPATWLIDRLGDTTDLKQLNEALAELGRRMKLAELPAAQQSAVFDKLLALQKDASLTWDRAWGDVLDRAYVAGDLSQAQRDSYHANLYHPQIKIRPKIGQHGELPVAILYNFRTGNSGSGGPQITLRSRLRSVKVVNGAVLKDEGPTWTSYGGSGVTGGGGGSSTSYFKLDDKLPPGEHQLEFVHEFQFKDSWSNNASVLHEISHTSTLPLTVTEDVSIAWATSDLTAEQMAAQIGIGGSRANLTGGQPVTAYTPTVKLRLSDHEARFDTAINVDGFREDFGCDVILEADGERFSLSSVYFAKDAKNAWHTSSNSISMEQAEKLKEKPATLRLVGSRKAAEKSLTLTQTWQGEVVIPDVKIEVEDSRTKK